MSRILQAAGRAIDAIRINSNTRELRDGKAFWTKRRRPWSPAIVHCANAFFRTAGNPVVVWADHEKWKRWEIDSFLLLHAGEGYAAFANGDESVTAEELPGKSIESAASAGTLTEAMIQAASCELARAHCLPWQPGRDGSWSHGDPHLGNFLYDPASSRTRLIDFEVAHPPEMGEAERRADDLLVFLQDLMGRVERAAWLPSALCFLHGYALCHPETEAKAALAALSRSLAPPQRFARLWWAIRTSYLPQEERSGRIAELQSAMRGDWAVGFE